MNRVIKFRAWHEELKCMLFPPAAIDSMINIRINGESGPHWKVDGEMVGAWMTWDGRLYVEGVNQRLIWLQFTGYHDRENKEIYEGDIIGFKRENRILAPRYIEFKHGAFCAIPIGERPNFEDYFGMPGNCEGGGNPWSIVGNIYQNPELLNFNYKL